MHLFKTFALFLTLAVAAPAVTPVAAQSTTRAQYIERYTPIAVAQAEKYGIPASIKMAQGILESGNGNGELARRGNTHFNIKVKPSDNWRGEVVYHDDDAPNEAFRAYDTPEESWIDHSEYLDNQLRYDSLFRYSVTDYRSWARGLKNCGYATDPLYAEKLIRIIEDNELWRLDRDGNISAPPVVLVVDDNESLLPPAPIGDGMIDVDNFTIAMNHIGGRELYRTSEGRFVSACEGDTLADIARLTGVRAGRLARLNRLDKNTALTAGQQIKID
jgi:hypothetical protein